MKKKLSLKKIFIVALSLLFVFSIFNVGKVLADTKVFKLLDAKINEKSDNTDASITADEDGIKTDITFHKVNEYVVYKLSFKNQDTKDYTIKSISDDNKDPYVSYIYDKHENETIKAGETKDILVKVSYDKEVTNVDDREDKEPVKLSFSLVDKEGNEVVDNITIDNPKTNDNISKYIVLSIISLSGIVLLVIKNNKTKKVLILVLMLTPFITKAFDSGFELTINNDIKFYDKLVVTLNVNGEEETKTVSYGDKVELPNPEKAGYKFLGWYNGSEKYDPESTVSNDLTITPKYEIITYTISYTGLEGTIPVVNNLEYNVETESFTLTNPTKLGYSFTGWTGTFSDVPQTRVTIDKGTTGNIELNAVFSPNDDTDYKVIHRYLNLDGETYVEEVEELKGTTDSTVRPQGKHKDGFVDKEDADLQNLTINGDGKSQVIYTYDRVMVNLSYTSDVESDFVEGQYKYGTQITVDVKEKTGYTFAGWANDYDGNSKLVYFDTNQNDIIDLGDIVFIGDNWFYVIAEPENEEVKLLPKYNISSNNRQSVVTNTYQYSSTYYWKDSSDYEPWGDSEYKYIYRDKYVNETDNNLKDKINSYKDYLNGLGIVNISDARLMAYEELFAAGCQLLPPANSNSCPTYLSTQGYWLGSDIQGYPATMGINGVGISGIQVSTVYGVRPIIIISSDDVKNVYNDSDSLSFSITEDINVVPFYKPNTNTPYKVIHRKQNVSGEGYTEFETEYKEGVTGYEITPEVHNYSGFQNPSQQTTTINADGSTEITYDYNRNQYSLTVNHPEWVADGDSKSGLYYYQQEVSLTALDREGYTFTNWSSFGGINKTFTLHMPTYNITVEPRYTRSLYTVTYNPNAGDAYVSLENEKVYHGNNATLPTPTRPGYVFNGWFTDEDDGIQILAPYSPTSDITLYAHWEEDTRPKAELYDLDGDLDVSVGDKVRIVDDYFYVIGRDEDDSSRLKLLAEYNLDYDNRQSEDDYYTTQFSSTNYWVSAGSSSSSSSSGGDSFSSDYVPWGASEYNYVYRNWDKGGAYNYIEPYLYQYFSHLYYDFNMNIYDIRLMAYEEAEYIGCEPFNSDTCPDFSSNQFYWLGSAYDHMHLWCVVDSYRGLGNYDYGFNGYIRPVIIVSESDISMPWDTNTGLVYYDYDKSNSINIGDSLMIASERFRIISEPDEEGNILLLPMYNIDSEIKQSPEQDYVSFDPTHGSNPFWRTYGLVNDNFEPWGTSSYYYVYRKKDNKNSIDGDTDNRFKEKINSYKDYLNALGIIDIFDARLMSYEEAVNMGCTGEKNSCPEYASNQHYWLGSLLSVGYDANVWTINSHELSHCLRSSFTTQTNGTRPVIVVKATDIPTNFE